MGARRVHQSTPFLGSRFRSNRNVPGCGLLLAFGKGVDFWSYMLSCIGRRPKGDVDPLRRRLHGVSVNAVYVCVRFDTTSTQPEGSAAIPAKELSDQHRSWQIRLV
jgi:hypothetical protein